MDLFFSRRIGLSDTGQEIPIIGGARMTGKMDGGHNIAVLDLQTQRGRRTAGRELPRRAATART